MARFVIVVDTQKDFMTAQGALGVTGAEALVEPMNAWLASLDPRDTAGVLFTFDTHEPEIYAGSMEAEAFPIHCVRGSEGWANLLDAALIDPAIPVWRIEKGVFDMWAEPGLEIEDARGLQAAPISREPFFADLKASDVDEVTVIGVAADYCVRWAIDGLIARGFAVTVPAALTRGIERQIETVAAQDFAGARLQVTAA
ncbi:isochorismatase [Novosphingobium barchaimii LL02]|uniref:nicotinamidase n=1 Tax=Novosphingobium barchaimii LL02 TaxID=1114963 RepID=A0A0J7XYG1_9SPHN|nr:isochorismatase family protein [Novosphingobium barchaimii]KMS56308.1 isochorismatase [Novosphingobium barchaimii LL02]